MPVCECMQCIQHKLPNRLPGEPTRGRRVSEHEKKGHRRQERGHALPVQSDSSEGENSGVEVAFSDNTQQGVKEKTSSTESSTPSKAEAASLEDLLFQVETQLAQLSVANHYRPGTLIFSNPPQAPHITLKSRKQLTLHEKTPSNGGIIGYTTLLEGHRAALCRYQPVCAEALVLRLAALLHDITVRLGQIEAILKNEWELQAQRLQESQGKIVVSVLDPTRFKNHDPALLTIYILGCILHLLCGVSIEQCNFVLHASRLLVSLVKGQVTSQDTSSHPGPQSSASTHIPIDLRTVMKTMAMDPKVDVFVCCPRCFCLYRIDPQNGESYPETCTNRDSPNKDPCKRTLRNLYRVKDPDNPYTVKDVWKPSREMLFRDIKEWIGTLYNRPDLEQFLDRSFEPAESNLSADHEMFDIWDAPALRRFQGPDGQPFIQQQGTEGRLVLCLNQDGLNPYGNLLAGKKVTVGAIYLVCLNLPPALRYDIDNMCLVGVIPGPHEPSRHQMNHVLAPVVQALKVLWVEGIYIQCTISHVYGRLVRAALFILVCDLLAARQVAGFAQHSHTFFCHLCKLKYDEARNLDFRNWPLRTYQEHCMAAREWQDAPTEEDREDVYNKSGLRWSVLMELPYWNSVQATLIDTMHCFFLRMLPHHCREVWGMDIKLEDGDPLSTSKVKSLSEAEAIHATGILRNGTDREVESLPMRALKHLCRDAGLPFGGRKKDPLVQYLKSLRTKQNWPIQLSSSTSHASPQVRHSNFTQDVTDSGLLSVDAVIQLYETASKSALASQLKCTLVFLATLIWQDQSKDDFEAMNKTDLAVQINNQRRIDGILDKNYKLIPAGASNSKSGKLTAVLGRNTLKEVRNDMKQLGTPSWFATAPPHPGEARWGKFNAGQWRAFCMVHLPITLIRLWGDKPDGSREKQMLENFMHLVTAISHATDRVMTVSQVQSYEYHMHRYLETLLEIYPGTAITPYQHLSLHLGRMLLDYGPTHSWRCFPFERANGRLQRVPTNHRFGEMEQTILRRFANIQHLHVIMHQQSLPPAVHDLIPVFTNTFSQDIQGKLSSSNALALDEDFRKIDDIVTWDASRETLLSLEDYRMLLQHFETTYPYRQGEQAQRKVLLRSHIKLAGRRYEATAGSKKSRWEQYNSMVTFQQALHAKEWSAGQILKIFSLRSGRRHQGHLETYQTFFVLDVFEPLATESTHLDPYRAYPPLGGRLFHTTSSGRLILPVDLILSHFAVLHRELDDIDKPCIHIIPLH